MTVFLDTVGRLVVWDESDQWHPAAQVCFSGWRISETVMPCQAFFLNFLTAIDKDLLTPSEWPPAGEAEAGPAGEHPAEE